MPPVVSVHDLIEKRLSDLRLMVLNDVKLNDSAEMRVDCWLRVGYGDPMVGVVLDAGDANSPRTQPQPLKAVPKPRASLDLDERTGPVF